jgi:hypothetical protein
LYARRQRLAVVTASTVIEGQSIDSLNIANLKRRVNRTFVVQEAKHTARIEGKNLEITWRYSGYCRAARASTMDFSIDSEARTSFDDLDCSTYDLGHDPGMARQIRPLLIGTDGISKKISVVSADIRHPRYCRFCRCDRRWGRARDTRIRRRARCANVGASGKSAKTDSRTD